MPIYKVEVSRTVISSIIVEVECNEEDIQREAIRAAERERPIAWDDVDTDYDVEDYEEIEEDA